MPTRVRSFSKINLGLAVGPPRADGFHGLTTLYQTLALHDDVEVTARRLPAGAPTRLTLACTRDGAPARGVPQTATGDAERNTAYRIVAGALAALGLAAEVHIAIAKRLPVQGGLGAGSANAAAALIALERELGLAGPGGLTGAQRLALAAETGSDVPLFLHGGSVLGTGRGEQVFPLPDVDPRPLPVMVAVPSVGVSTREAFARLDRRFSASAGGPDLTPAAPVDKLEQLSYVLSAAYTAGSQGGPSGITPPRTPGSTATGQGQALPASQSSAEAGEGDLAENPADQFAGTPGGQSPLLALVRTGLVNDFEGVAFEQHPSLRDLKQALLGEKAVHAADAAVYAALSGSGSALFGVYATQRAAVAAQQRVHQLGARALLTETLPRHGYWARMFVD